MQKPLSIQCYCDADSAFDPDERRSTSGICVFLGPTLSLWWSKKQTVVARRSTTEADYRSLAAAAAEILWLQTLLSELQVPSTVSSIFYDNLSKEALSHNPVLHPCTKHMDLDLFFVHEKVLKKSLVVQHLPAQFQIADNLTKALSPTHFVGLKSKLNICDQASLIPP